MHKCKGKTVITTYFMLAEYFVMLLSPGLGFYVCFEYLDAERGKGSVIFFIFILFTNYRLARAFIYHLSKHIWSAAAVEILGFNIYSATVTYNDTIVLGTLLAQNKRHSLCGRIYNLQITQKLAQSFQTNILILLLENLGVSIFSQA